MKKPPEEKLPMGPKISPQVLAYYKRTRFNPIRNLDPETLSRQLDSFASGYLRDFAITADTIARRDDKMVAALPKRYKAPSRHSYSVQVNDGLNASQEKRAQEHAASLRYCYDNLTASHALDRNQKGGWRLLVRQMMEAVGNHYAVHDLVWQPRIVEGRPQLTFTAYYTPLWFFENTTGELRFLKNIHALEGEAMDPSGWLVTVGDGIMEALSICYMFKSMSLKDWVAFSEKFGMPGLLGKTSSSKESPGWNAMVEAVEAFGQDWAAVVSQGETIELIETKGGGQLPFGPLVELMDRAIVSICRGGDLSTMSKGGDAVGSNSQAGETELLEEDDAEMINETLQHISRLVINELYGEEPLAYVQIVVPQKQGTEEVVKKIDTLVRHDVPVGVEWARAELGVPAPAKDEDVLKKPAGNVMALPPATASRQPGALPRPGEEEDTALANAGGEVSAKPFDLQARKELSEAQRMALRGPLDRLLRLLEIEDETELRIAAEQFQKDLPALSRPILTDPVTAKVWREIIGTAVVSGFIEAATSRDQPITDPTK